MTAYAQPHTPLLRGPRTKSSARRERPHEHGILDTVKQLPAYARLVAGLLRDPRVATFDKLLVAAAVGYIVSPINLIPDFIPVLGELDDLFVILLALQHLVANAGPEVVMTHWHGDPDELDRLDLRRALVAAAFFLPRRLRRRLRIIGRAD